MKQILILLLLSLSLFMIADSVTMDLTTAKNLNSSELAYSEVYGDGYYNLSDVWDCTYNDSNIYRYISVDDGVFMLSHMPSENSYGGQSWEGFTLSRVSQDTANVFGCVANGGLRGVGTPYIIGYYSEWVTETLGQSSNIILFEHEYYPEYVYICQNSNTMEAINNGNVFNARAFTEKDTLSLVISGLDSCMNEVSVQNYYMAVNGEKNNGWAKVSLAALGRVSGLSFRLTTTDIGEWGANTPLYFALDGLTINTEPLTDLHYNQIGRDDCKKIVRCGQIFILRGKKMYTLLGQKR